MRFSASVLLSAVTGLTAAVPFSFPLRSGFPNLNATELAKGEKAAGGSLPNVPLPTSLKANGTGTLQFIVLNELFEVAYFTDLIYNITHEVEGYRGTPPHVLESLHAIVNQEQLHALAANAILASAKQTQIQPCKYAFPVTDFESAILLAETFTEVVLGVLPTAQSVFAADGGDESALVPVIGSIIAQEGEQTGLFRVLQRKAASAAPFLTGEGPNFAFTALQQFIVPGSCPNINVIPFETYPALTVETVPTAKSSEQLFSVEGVVSASNASVAYLSGQNLPVTVPISHVSYDGWKSYFFAEFPFDCGFAKGLTIAAVVKGSGVKFNTTTEVAAATLYGPGLIVID